MNRRFWLLALISSVVTLAAGTAMAQTKTVSGTVTYLNRSALAPGAVLDVELVDVSRADALSIQLSARRFAISRVPFPFELAYDAALIDQRFTYAIQARISLDGQVIYRSTTRNAVLTRGAPDKIDITLDLMPSPASLDLAGTTWQVTEMGGQIISISNPPSISFVQPGAVGITGGCNSFRGPVEITGNAIRFSDTMAGTAMACVPERNKIEQEFLELLRDVTSYALSDAGLRLLNRAGEPVILLAPTPK